MPPIPPFHDSFLQPLALKTISINQPYFFPYVGYFKLIQESDAFVLYPHVLNHSKSWVARNRYVLNGELRFFSVPISKATRRSNISEIEFVDFDAWMEGQMTMCRQADHKPPFYEETVSFLEAFSSAAQACSSSCAIICESVRSVCEHLGISTSIVLHPSEPAWERELEGMSDADARRCRRIVQICSDSEATHYLNLPGGRSLYSPEAFKRHGVDLQFLNVDFQGLTDLGLEHPDASILHAMMHLGKEQLSHVLCRPSTLQC